MRHRMSLLQSPLKSPGLANDAGFGFGFGLGFAQVPISGESKKYHETAESEELPPTVDVFEDEIVAVRFVAGVNANWLLTGAVAPTLLSSGHVTVTELTVLELADRVNALLPVTPQVPDTLIPSIS